LPASVVVTSSTRLPVRRLSMSPGSASVAKRSSCSASSVRWLTSSRSLLLSLRIAATWSSSASAAGPLNAAVPTTNPIASAMNTAAKDTTWYRKLITISPLRIGSR
jgi:hypothetical protein